jgi:hypothetical protein
MGILQILLLLVLSTEGEWDEQGIQQVWEIYTDSVQNAAGEIHLNDLVVNDRIILKRILKETGCASAGWIYFGLVPVAGSIGHIGEAVGSRKRRTLS